MILLRGGVERVEEGSVYKIWSIGGDLFLHRGLALLIQDLAIWRLRNNREN